MVVFRGSHDGHCCVVDGVVDLVGFLDLLVLAVLGVGGGVYFFEEEKKRMAKKVPECFYSPRIDTNCSSFGTSNAEVKLVMIMLPSQCPASVWNECSPTNNFRPHSQLSTFAFLSVPLPTLRQ